MAEIYVPANETWEFFRENKERLSKEMVTIAEDQSAGSSICMTEKDGFPVYVVYYNDKIEYTEETLNEIDTKETAKEIYTAFLNEDSDFGNGDSLQDQEDQAYEREDQLTLALCDFLEVVLDENKEGIDILAELGEDTVSDILDNFLSYLSDEYSIQIYRPTFVTDPDTGEEIFTEYPYL